MTGSDHLEKFLKDSRRAVELLSSPSQTKSDSIEEHGGQQLIGYAVERIEDSEADDSDSTDARVSPFTHSSPPHSSPSFLGITPLKEGTPGWRKVQLRPGLLPVKGRPAKAPVRRSLQYTSERLRSDSVFLRKPQEPIVAHDTEIEDSGDDGELVLNEGIESPQTSPVRPLQSVERDSINQMDIGEGQEILEIGPTQPFGTGVRSLPSFVHTAKADTLNPREVLYDSISSSSGSVDDGAQLFQPAVPSPLQRPRIVLQNRPLVSSPAAKLLQGEPWRKWPAAVDSLVRQMQNAYVRMRSKKDELRREFQEVGVISAGLETQQLQIFEVVETFIATGDVHTALVTMVSTRETGFLQFEPGINGDFGTLEEGATYACVIVSTVQLRPLLEPLWTASVVLSYSAPP
uniref:Uncharacterized protein n=1 Tax=Palpitomonas bilix TaxID=652834 RepID=A0A7S3DIC8_9EUKA|mmetsp:Transcript_39176/g.100374  ORF Transcript_39176/g.100374 Transcript_39176/m.100374 type:complete len:403 (+) Transcript_39176:166-1374(+)